MKTFIAGILGLSLALFGTTAFAAGTTSPEASVPDWKSPSYTYGQYDVHSWGNWNNPEKGLVTKSKCRMVYIAHKTASGGVVYSTVPLYTGCTVKSHWEDK